MKKNKNTEVQLIGLTGQTGAGKSIVIGSVNVALGTGNFRDYVPEGADYALVELNFATDSPQVRQKLEQLQIPMEDGQVVISRKYQKEVREHYYDYMFEKM